MEALTDVVVTLDVQQATPPLNFGKLAVFVKNPTPKDSEQGAPESITSYTTLDDVVAKEDGETLQNLARGYFNQDEHANELIVIKYKDISKVLDAYYSEDWEFSALISDDTSSADMLAISNYVEGKGSKFFVNGTSGPTEVASDFDVNTLLVDLTKIKSNERTIDFIAGSDANSTAYAVGALIGKCANKTVGSLTWKSMTLSGVNPISFSAGQVATIHKAGAFTYVTKAGINQTSEGITVGGEYIDALHGDDWIKSNIENELQTLISTNDKVPYDDNGIAQIKAVVTEVLMEATANGIILVDLASGAGVYTVTATSRANTSASDIATRQYNGLSFTYQRSGAIHTMTVHGTVIL